MQVTVHAATLTINEKTIKLTKPTAEQFPTQPWNTRYNAARANQPAPAPLCKTNGTTLDSHEPWLLLIPDTEAGLVWTPHVHKADYELGLVQWYDDLEDIPTVIL